MLAILAVLALQLSEPSPQPASNPTPVSSCGDPSLPPCPPTLPYEEPEWMKLVQNKTWITEPDWVRRPSGDDIQMAYPRSAYDAQASGKVKLMCVVTEKLRLAQCIVTSETPEGLGFADAALKLTRYFRLGKSDACSDPRGCVVMTYVFFNWKPY